MAYCTVYDAQSYLIHITLSDTSQPTKEQVSNLCDHVSNNIIDPIIRDIVGLPVTDEVGLNYLKQGAIYFVLASVYRSFHGMSETVISLEKQFDDFRKTIKSVNSVLAKPNYNMPSTSHSTRGDVKFKIDEDQW